LARAGNWEFQTEQRGEIESFGLIVDCTVVMIDGAEVPVVV
jgi:hypothetical protein